MLNFSNDEVEKLSKTLVQNIESLMKNGDNVSLQTILVADGYFELLQKISKTDRNILERVIDEKAAATFFNLSYDGTKFQKLLAMKFIIVLSEMPQKSRLIAFVIQQFEQKLGQTQKLTVSLLSENEREAEISNRIDQKNWGSYSGKYLSYQLTILNWMLRQW